MKYFWVDVGQTIQYDVLHYMERGACQCIHVVRMSAKTARPLKSSQVSAALQALRRAGLIENDGRWVFANPAMREVQRTAN